jgi:thiol:disulfide interchange protein DsbD
MRSLRLLAALVLPCLLHAGEAEKPLEIRLISEARSIAAGQPFVLGLHLVHPPGSHTYWKNPGIVGLATTIEWDLPRGFSAGEIQWPAPRVVKMASYEAQGYEGETLLMIPVTPPQILGSTTATLNARVSWMCCGKTCMPAVKVPFSITLPVAASAAPDPATAPLFGKFRARIPRPDPAWQATARREQGKLILTLQPPRPLADPGEIHFFTADGQVDSNAKQQVAFLAGGAIRLTLCPSGTAAKDCVSLPGVVSLENGKSPLDLAINPDY